MMSGVMSVFLGLAHAEILLDLLLNFYLDFAFGIGFPPMSIQCDNNEIDQQDQPHRKNQLPACGVVALCNKVSQLLGNLLRRLHALAQCVGVVTGGWALLLVFVGAAYSFKDVTAIEVAPIDGAIYGEGWVEAEACRLGPLRIGL